MKHKTYRGDQRDARQQEKKANRFAVWMLAAVTSAALISISVFLVQEPAEAADITVYKSPTCGCCGKWVEHLEANGFSVDVKQQRDLRSIKQQLGIQRPLQSCHTGVIDGYIIEGHVPAADIHRLLEQRPAVRGLAVPGMPMGSPGMEGPRPQPYEVVTFDVDGNTRTFSRHSPGVSPGSG